MLHEATQALYGYWNEVRRGRIAPNRLEIEPHRLGAVLLDAFILERHDEKTFRFRITGTNVAARFGMDLRETNFLDRWCGADRSMIEAHLAQTVERGRVALLTVEAMVGDAAGREKGQLQTLEILILPLIHGGAGIDRLLCLIVPVDATEASPARVRDMRLAVAEYIWPERTSAGRHGTMAGRGGAISPERQSPLSPHIRNSRIVKQGRRQFRVYEGGLTGQSGD